MKKAETTHYFSEEITREILLRLPTKACLKAKLVCKNWYNMIMDPNFTYDFRKGLKNSRISLLFYGPYSGEKPSFMLVELDKSSTDVDESGYLKINDDHKLRFHSKFDFPNRALTLCNELNGLVCFKGPKDWDKFYIRNLMTNESVLVKQTRRIPMYYSWTFGLGCCPITNKLKLLRIITYQEKRLAEIQTISIDKDWRSIGDAPPLDVVRPAALLNGILHWCSADDSSIWSFNFGIEQFVRIPVPDEITIHHWNTMLTAFDSSLCLCHASRTDTQNICQIWAMEYGVEESWVKQFVLKTQETELNYYWPLARMDGAEILMKGGGYKLLFYNHETGAVREVKVPELPEFQVVTFETRFFKL